MRRIAKFGGEILKNMDWNLARKFCIYFVYIWAEIVAKNGNYLLA